MRGQLILVALLLGAFASSQGWAQADFSATNYKKSEAKWVVGDGGDLDIGAEGFGALRVKKISITSTPTGSEQDSGFDLPTKAIVHTVVLDVTTAEATGGTKTLDVGTLSSETGGDADGFFSSVTVDTTGVTVPSIWVTTGSNEVYLSGNTVGALLNQFTAGSDASTDVGTSNPQKYIPSWTGGAVSITYTADDSDWAEFRGDIYVIYTEIE